MIQNVRQKVQGSNMFRTLKVGLQSWRERFSWLNLKAGFMEVGSLMPGGIDLMLSEKSTSLLYLTGKRKWERFDEIYPEHAVASLRDQAQMDVGHNSRIGCKNKKSKKGGGSTTSLGVAGHGDVASWFTKHAGVDWSVHGE
ncbi:hypothetical protein Tco_1046569 [Tanacetum coccineum]